ncbi:MAG: hypothetical protein ACHQ2E_07850, partial [Gemmatimonadales bacterium]
MVNRGGSSQGTARLITAACAMAAGLGITAPIAAQSDTSAALDVSEHETRARSGRIDNWLSYQDNFDDSEQWNDRVKFFAPVGFRHGWTFTQRLDLQYVVTNKPGPANPGGVWKGRIGDALIEEIFDTPNLGNNFRAWSSLRFVAPTGGPAPFGSDQWQIAVALGTSRKAGRLLAGLALSPYARYSWGFAPQDTGVTLVRKLNILPTVGYKLVNRVSISLYPEQGILLNANNGKWFVPIEAMLMYRGRHRGEFGLGGAYGLVTDYKVYQWLV